MKSHVFVWLSALPRINKMHTKTELFLFFFCIPSYVRHTVSIRLVAHVLKVIARFNEEGKSENTDSAIRLLQKSYLLL